MSLHVQLTPIGVAVSVHDDPDRLTDDPAAHAAFLDSWQRAVDRGEFCPTCGRDADSIVARSNLFNCRGCGDCWPAVESIQQENAK